MSIIITKPRVDPEDLEGMGGLRGIPETAPLPIDLTEEDVAGPGRDRYLDFRSKVRGKFNTQQASVNRPLEIDPGKVLQVGAFQPPEEEGGGIGTVAGIGFVNTAAALVGAVEALSDGALGTETRQKLQAYAEELTASLDDETRTDIEAAWETEGVNTVLNNPDSIFTQFVLQLGNYASTIIPSAVAGAAGFAAGGPAGAVIAGMATGALSEGSLVAGATYSEFAQGIENADEATLSSSPVYITLRSQVGDAEARKRLISIVGRAESLETGLVSAGFGAVSGAVLGKLFGKGFKTLSRKGRTGVGALSETLTEAPQEAFEQYSGNVLAQQTFDPSRTPSQGVLGAAAAGAVLSAGPGGVAGALSPNRNADVPDDIDAALRKEIDQLYEQTAEPRYPVGQEPLRTAVPLTPSQPQLGLTGGGITEAEQIFQTDVDQFGRPVPAKNLAGERIAIPTVNPEDEQAAFERQLATERQQAGTQGELVLQGGESAQARSATQETVGAKGTPDQAGEITFKTRGGKTKTVRKAGQEPVSATELAAEVVAKVENLRRFPVWKSKKAKPVPPDVNKLARDKVNSALRPHRVGDRTSFSKAVKTITALLDPKRDNSVFNYFVGGDSAADLILRALSNLTQNAQQRLDEGRITQEEFAAVQATNNVAGQALSDIRAAITLREEGKGKLTKGIERASTKALGKKGATIPTTTSKLRSAARRLVEAIAISTDVKAGDVALDKLMNLQDRVSGPADLLSAIVSFGDVAKQGVDFTTKGKETGLASFKNTVERFLGGEIVDNELTEFLSSLRNKREQRITEVVDERTRETTAGDIKQQRKKVTVLPSLESVLRDRYAAEPAIRPLDDPEFIAEYEALTTDEERKNKLKEVLQRKSTKPKIPKNANRETLIRLIKESLERERAITQGYASALDLAKAQQLEVGRRETKAEQTRETKKATKRAESAEAKRKPKRKQAGRETRERNLATERAEVDRITAIRSLLALYKRDPANFVKNLSKYNYGTLKKTLRTAGITFKGNLKRVALAELALTNIDFLQSESALAEEADQLTTFEEQQTALERGREKIAEERERVQEAARQAVTDTNRLRHGLGQYSRERVVTIAEQLDLDLERDKKGAVVGTRLQLIDSIAAVLSEVSAKDRAKAVREILSLGDGNTVPQLERVISVQINKEVKRTTEAKNVLKTGAALTEQRSKHGTVPRTKSDAVKLLKLLSDYLVALDTFFNKTKQPFGFTTFKKRGVSTVPADIVASRERALDFDKEPSTDLRAADIDQTLATRVEGIEAQDELLENLEERGIISPERQIEGEGVGKAKGLKARTMLRRMANRANSLAEDIQKRAKPHKKKKATTVEEANKFVSLGDTVHDTGWTTHNQQRLRHLLGSVDTNVPAPPVTNSRSSKLSMHGPGMWMPTRKSGKNWVVNYTITINGETIPQSRKFRVKADAQEFINRAKQNLAQDERVTGYQFKTAKLSLSDIEKENAVPLIELVSNDRISRAVGRLNAEFPGADIKVVDSRDPQVQAELENEIDFRETAAAAYVHGVNGERDQIYIFKDKVFGGLTTVRQLALHEMFHKGLRKMFEMHNSQKGLEAYNELMDDIYARVPVKYKPLLKAIEGTYDLDNTIADDRRLAAEELVAAIAEGGVSFNDAGLIKLLSRVVEFVRKFLERIGVVTSEDAWTDQDYHNLIAEAHNALGREQAQAGLPVVTTNSNLTGARLKLFSKELLAENNGSMLKSALATVKESGVASMVRQGGLGFLNMRQIDSSYSPRFQDEDTNSLSDYMTALNEKAQDIHRDLQSLTELNNDWSRLKAEGKAKKNQVRKVELLMGEATLNRMHPNHSLTSKPNEHLLNSRHNKALHNRLSKVWESLDKDVQDLYLKVQKYYKDDFNAKRASAVRNIFRMFNVDQTDITTDPKDLTINGGKKLDKDTRRVLGTLSLTTKLKGPYFRLSRFGDWVVSGLKEETVIADNTEQAEKELKEILQDKYKDIQGKVHYEFVNGEVHASYERQYVSFFESERKAWQAIREMRADPKYTKTPSNPERKHNNQFAFIPDMKFLNNMLNKISERTGDDKVKGSMATAMREVYLEMLPETSIRKTELKRANVLGYSTDMQRTFAAHGRASAYHKGQLKWGAELSEQMTAMKDFTRAQRDVDVFQPVRQDVVNHLTRHDQMQANLASPMNFVGKISDIGFVWYLLSPSYWFVNSTQPYMLTLPWLGSRYGYTKSTAAMARAYKEIFPKALDASVRSGFGLRAMKSFETEQELFDVQQLIENIGKTDSQRADMLRYLGDQNLLEISFAAALREEATNTATRTDRTWNRIMEITRSMPHVAEVMNRTVTALAAYDLEMARSKDFDKAKLAARNAVADTQFDYSGINKPLYFSSRFFAPAGPLTMFKQHAQNVYYQIIKSTLALFKGEDRVQAAKYLVGIFGTHASMAGVIGATFEPIKWAIGAAMWMVSDEDEPPFSYEEAVRDTMAAVFGPRAGELFARGLPRYFHADLSQRVGLHNMMFMDRNMGPSDRNAVQNFMFAALGPLASIPESMWNGMIDYKEGDYIKGTERLLPKGFRDVLKVARMNREGITDATGNIILDSDYLGPWDFFLQAMGISPGKASEMYEARSAVKRTETALNKRRSQLFEIYRRSGNRADVWKNEIQPFNRTNPEFRIRYDQLRRSLREKSRREAVIRDTGVYVDRRKRRRLLRESESFNVGDRRRGSNN